MESSLDLLHDPERHTEGHPPLVAGHDHGSLSSERGNEALQLELQWLAIRRVELYAIHERQDVSWRGANREWVEVGAEAEEFASARGQIERQISALLKDPDLPLSLPRDAAGRDVGDGARVERYARVRNVEHGSEHGNSDRRDVAGFRADQREEQVDVVDHEIEHHGDIRAPRAERRQSLAVDEPWHLHVWKRCTHRPIEPLDVANLDHHASFPGELEESIGLFQRRRDRLFDEDVLAALDSRARDGEMRRGGHDDDDRIGRFEEISECRVAPHL